MSSCVDWFGDGSILVVDLSLACCAVESEFAVPIGAPRLERVPDADSASAGRIVVAVVSGTLTEPVAGLVASRIEALGPETLVVAFGACACAGGPYWDSQAVTPGVSQLGLASAGPRIDHVIPGCPPPPDALAGYIDSLRTRLSAGASC